MSLTVKELLSIGKRQLEECNIDNADIDCKLLYCFLMNKTTAQLILEYQRILPDGQCDEYFKLLDRRSSGVPLQYITGSQEFMGYEFNVNEKVLIPRQDTETLVEDALSVMTDNTLRGETLPIKKRKEWDVLDLCCGSGAIGISICKMYGKANVTCSDISGDALEVARENAQKLDAKITFKEGNLLEPFTKKFKNKKFDMIISNPPYIKSQVIGTLQREVKDFEPMMALDGGESGLDFYEEIIGNAADYLKKEGVLMFEIGHDQMEEVCQLIENTGRFENITGLKDLAGRDRIVFATLGNKKK